MTLSIQKSFGAMQISHLYGLDAVNNVGRYSSTWQIIEAFVRQNEAVASRASFGSSGVILMTTVPGDPTSGMFYIYDARTKTFFMIDFEGRDNFTPSQFDEVVTDYGLEGLVSFPMEGRQAARPQQHHHHGRRHFHAQQPAILIEAA